MLRPPLSLLSLAKKRPVVSLSYIIPQVTRRVIFRLTEAIAKPLKPVTLIPDFPIVRTHLRHGFDVVQGTPRPQTYPSLTTTAIVMPRTAPFAPDHLRHERIDVRKEITNGFGFGLEAVHVLRLPAIAELEHVVCLRF